MKKLIISSYILFFTLIYQITSASIPPRSKRQATDFLTIDQFREPDTTEFDFTSGGGIKLFNVIKFRASPVSNAKVTATLVNGQDNFSIVLKEDDFGEKGTYIGTIQTCTKSGRYAITYLVEIVDETCKLVSPVDCEKLGTMSPNTREGESVTFKNCEATGYLEGDKVRDLIVTFNKTDSQYTAKWSESWNPATVVEYKLYSLAKFTEDVQEWLDDGRVLLDLMPAQPIKENRNIVIDLSGINGEIYLAIVAQGASAASKALSNIFPVYILNVIESTTEMTDTTEMMDTTEMTNTTTGISEFTSIELNEISSTETLTTHFNDSSAPGIDSWVIVGIVMAVLVLVGVIVMLVLISKYKHFYKARIV